MEDVTSILSQPVARLGATTITLGHALAFTLALLLALLLGVVTALWRSSRARAAAAAEAAEHARDVLVVLQQFVFPGMIPSVPTMP